MKKHKIKFLWFTVLLAFILGGCAKTITPGEDYSPFEKIADKSEVKTDVAEDDKTVSPQAEKIDENDSKGNEFKTDDSKSDNSEENDSKADDSKVNDSNVNDFEENDSEMKNTDDMEEKTRPCGA